VVEGVALLVWGPDPKRVPFFGDADAFTLAGGRIRYVEALLISVAIVLPLVIHFISRKTLVGLTMLATAEDPEAAQLRGIKVRLVVIGAFVLAGGLAGAVAVLVAPVTLAMTDVGNLLAVKAFVALALGGFGSQPGALLGGFATGLAESLTARYIGPEYTDPVVFALLLVVLMVSPGGVLGRAQARHV
jgi:branched-chain amino acid transport system permease protein